MKRFLSCMLALALMLGTVFLMSPAAQAAEERTATTRTVSRIENGGILVEWDAVEGASGYVIYRRAMKVGTTTWTTFARWNNTKELSFLDTKVYEGTKYQYGIKAYYGSDPTTKTDLSPVGPMSTALVYAKKPGTTATTKAVNDGEFISVSWSKVSGAAGYIIYRRAWSSTTNGWTAFERWNTTQDTTFNDSRVYPGSKYQYGIKAYYGSDSRNMANVGNVGPIATMVRIRQQRLTYSFDVERKEYPPTNEIYGDIDEKEIHMLSWDPSRVYTGYVIQYSKSPTFDTKQTITISDNTTSQKRLPDLDCTTYYYARVRNYMVVDQNTYYGMWSNTVQFYFGHVMVNYRITKPATCMEAGSSDGSCPRCGYLITLGLEPFQHNFVNGKCTRCGEFESGTVYVVSGGKCYHSSPNCSSMKNPTAMSKTDAIASGRTACPKCW